MNQSLHDIAKDRIVANAYRMVGYIDALLQTDAIPERHIDTAHELIAAHDAAAADRKTVLGAGHD